MKSLILVILSLISVSAFAKTPYDICDSLFTSTEKLNCLSTIADKVYIPQEIKICNDLFTSQDKLTCLNKAGSSVYCPTITVTRNALNEILNDISAGDYRGAFVTTNALLDRFQACQ